MTTTLFPIYPEGTKMINSEIRVKTIGEDVYYFNGSMAIYQHHKKDYQSFRHATSQMIALGNVQQTEIIKFFKVSKGSVQRWVKKYRDEGSKAFYTKRNGGNRGTVLTPEIKEEVQVLLNLGSSPKDIQDELGIKADTIRKAIRFGKLTRPDIKNIPKVQAKTQSQRNIEDSEAPLGMGTTNTKGRIDAIIKKKQLRQNFRIT